jgi:hypothetical protein
VVQYTNQGADAVQPVQRGGPRFTITSVPPGLRMRPISARVLSGSVKWITRPMNVVSKARNRKPSYCAM